MKKMVLIAATIAAAYLPLVSEPAPAYADGAFFANREEFVKIYNTAAANGTRLGAIPAESCSQASCIYTMAWTSDGYINSLHREKAHSGRKKLTLCFAHANSPNRDLCANSEGAFWEEHFDGTKWTHVRDFRTAWGE
jgi:hypothetical protein